MKKKLVHLGDINSINIELIIKSHSALKSRVEYILLGNIKDLLEYQKKIHSYIPINEIYDPINFIDYKKNSLNIFNIDNISKKKYINLLNQIEVSNKIANSSNLDLVTLPINKFLFKKEISFVGMTEYLAEINNKKTTMLMRGEKFSIIPLTTHINIGDIKKFIKQGYLKSSLNFIMKQIKRDIYKFNFKKIKFLCVNPHCSENNTIGNEDKIIKKCIINYKEILGPHSADSAFEDLDSQTLYISMYHDQALIPFKILNNKGINLTLGLNYRRLSPAHGTAKDIIFQNKAKINSYLACMEF